MNIEDLMKESEGVDSMKTASLEFCVVVCSYLLAEKCETAEEVNHLREAVKERYDEKEKQECEQLKEVDPIQSILLKSMAGGDLSEQLKEKYIQVREANDNLFNGVVELQKHIKK